MALVATEFLHRFCLHILPSEFQRIRHYGILSNFPSEKWQEYINEPTIADAILDRLVSKAHHVELTGKRP